jgi:predicted amidohydrolase YtcJ
MERLTMTRRDMMKRAAAFAGGLALPRTLTASRGQGSAAGSSRTVGSTDVALVNGKFVDGRGYITSALSIKNGRISNVGSEEKRGDDVRVIDLQGRTVVPGLFDSHIHYARAGVNPGYEARGIERAFSILELQEAIAERAKKVPAGAFITCIGGWNHLQLAEARRPTKADLDAAAPDHAVYISGPGGDTGAIANKRGQTMLASAGVTVDDATGRVSSPDAALAALQAAQTLEDKRRGTASLNAHANALGLTAVKNSGNLDDLDRTLELWRQGNLSVRMRPTFSAGSPMEVEARVANNFSQEGRAVGDDMFRVVGFGERVGGMTTTSAAFEPTARVVARHRWLLEQHSLTSAENAFHLAAFQSIAKDYPLKDLRWTLIHANNISEQVLKALIDLGVGVLPHGSARYLGTTPNAGPPFRRIADSGVIAGAGSDATNVAPLDPWLALFYMTTGRNLAGQLTNDGQQVSRVEALRMYTTGTAYYTFDDQDLGSFEVGKYADLAVLSEDYLEVPDYRIRKIESVLTLVGGDVVHAVSPFTAVLK